MKRACIIGVSVGCCVRPSSHPVCSGNVYSVHFGCLTVSLSNTVLVCSGRATASLTRRHALPTWTLPSSRTAGPFACRPVPTLPQWSESLPSTFLKTVSSQMGREQTAPGQWESQRLREVSGLFVWSSPWESRSRVVLHVLPCREKMGWSPHLQDLKM